MIRSIAFHPKAMNDINNNGRSSDLFLLQAPPGRIFQWHRVIVCNVARNLQQRDCPGFTPDSLLIAFPEEGERTNA